MSSVQSFPDRVQSHAAQAEELAQQPEPNAYVWLITQAYEIRRQGTPWAKYLADQIDRLAGNVAFTHSVTPEDLAERLEVLEQGRIERAIHDARWCERTFDDALARRES